MVCFPISLSLISAFVPAPLGAANQPAATTPPLVAQATTPEPVAPPPQFSPPPQAQTAPTQTATMGSQSPSMYAAPPPPLGLAAPALKGPTVWGILAYGGFGVGARFAIPVYGSVLHHPTLRDGFAVEFGADYVHWSETAGVYDWSYNVFRAAAGVMWDIWVNDQFAFYPKVELGYNHWSYNYGGYTITQNYSPIFFNGAAGALYRLNAGLTLRAEIGYTGLAVGVGWLF
jgi:hypothetical protein